MIVFSYWSIDVPGLDAEGAEGLAKIAREMPSAVGASVVDPKFWLTRHMDVHTVQLVMTALDVATQSGRLTHNAQLEVAQLLDDYRQWLIEAGHLNS